MNNRLRKRIDALRSDRSAPLTYLEKRLFEWSEDALRVMEYTQYWYVRAKMEHAKEIAELKELHNKEHEELKRTIKHLTQLQYAIEILNPRPNNLQPLKEAGDGE